MSLDEQHAASERARAYREQAESLLMGVQFDNDGLSWGEVTLLAMGRLLLAIEDRLNYGGQSILDGTRSCKKCRAILLDDNFDAHWDWHERTQT